MRLSTTEDLYPHKLSVILGKGKRFERLLQVFPTESRFKSAGLAEVAKVIGIKNTDSKIMSQLADLDLAYHELTSLRYGPELSVAPGAGTVMGVDTEYLLSPLDSIQFVIFQRRACFAGMIFTNTQLAEAVPPRQGIRLLREVIRDFQPDVIVGHNFNCDISVLERVYGEPIPELHSYDDTMKMARKSHVANLIGSAALKKLVRRLFSIRGLNIYAAYENIPTFIEYGLMDAVFPYYLRYFFLTGQKPDYLRPKQIDYMIHSKNNFQIKYEKIHFPDE